MNIAKSILHYILSIEILLPTTLVLLLLLQTILNFKYYIVLDLYCKSSTVIKIPILLSNVVIDCSRDSIYVCDICSILPYIFIPLVVLTYVLYRRFLYRSSIFTIFTKCLTYSSTILLIPLPLYYNIGTVSFTLIISNPLLSSCIYIMQIPAIFLSRVFPEDMQITEIFVSIDELTEDTMTIHEEESE